MNEMENPLEHLFETSKACISVLQGRELDTDLITNESLLSIHSTEGFLANLHRELNKAHPEAGVPYWRVRSWGLSCWQPIYLALICVYHLKLVPNSLSRLHQNQQAAYIVGYALPNEVNDENWFSGDHQQLVEFAAAQLKTLFNALQEEHLKQFGGRQVLYQALLADQFMTSMLVAQQMAFHDVEEKLSIHENERAIKEEYTLWANVLGLPLTPIERMHHEKSVLTFTRRSCCLHYRRDDGELCAECPRHKKNKANKEQDVRIN